MPFVVRKNRVCWAVIALVCTLAISSCGGSNNSALSNSNSMFSSSNDNKAGAFWAHLSDDFSRPTDVVASRLLSEYGAVFVARGGAIAPKTVVFKNDAEVAAFQSSVATTQETVGGIAIELQSPAMKALQDAAAEAVNNGLTITPRGADSAKRSYDDTVNLWKSRVEPGLTHWIGQVRITEKDADRIRSLSPYQQVPEIFRLESQGIFFAKDFSKSIIYSVAPPGTSQHLLMLALDISEFENPQVRAVLARHGWYQTVVSDLPHFTFLGTEESGLSALGLKKVESEGRVFWVPHI
ncbi:hypothetical protein BH10ACI3_BH10ACI3_29500 [soil metagenome]